MESFHVLCVDDEAGYLETLMKRMKKRNISVSGVHSGLDAITFLSQNRIDVVVMDVRMPGMDGIETLRRIKQTAPLVQVILLTGHASIDVARKGIEIGAFDYLMKPVELEELIFKIQDAYKKKCIQEKKIECGGNVAPSCECIKK